jgi:predicted transcriptional regulator
MNRTLQGHRGKAKPPPKITMAIPTGDQLKKLRESRGLSVLALSKKAKVPRQSLMDWESGKRIPRWGTVWKVWNCLEKLPKLPDLGMNLGEGPKL